MACESWGTQLDRYVDGELGSAEANALSTHLRTCADCAADALGRVQLKRAVSTAGTKRYLPTADFRAKITKLAAGTPRRQRRWHWKILAVSAGVAVILAIVADVYINRDRARRQQVYSELADLHVAALASATPVDVVSSDRHTVKPWFEGKIPFTFNLPELQGSNFTLVGGRVTYLAQTPGAQLIYQLRKHEISVFIFQDRGEEAARLPSRPVQALSFTMETWTHNGLRYVVVGDVGGDDIEALSKLLRGAG